MMERFELRKARLAVPAAGIRCGRYLAFNRAAAEQLIGRSLNVEVFFDLLERKIGFKFLAQPTAFSYRVSISRAPAAAHGAPGRAGKRRLAPQNAAINCPTFLRHCGAPRTQKPRPLTRENGLWTLKLAGPA